MIRRARIGASKGEQGSALTREEQYTAGSAGDLPQTLTLLAELRRRQHRYKEAAALKERVATMQSAFR